MFGRPLNHLLPLTVFQRAVKLELCRPLEATRGHKSAAGASLTGEGARKNLTHPTHRVCDRVFDEPSDLLRERKHVPKMGADAAMTGADKMFVSDKKKQFPQQQPSNECFHKLCEHIL